MCQAPSSEEKEVEAVFPEKELQSGEAQSTWYKTASPGNEHQQVPLGSCDAGGIMLSAKGGELLPREEKVPETQPDVSEIQADTILICLNSNIEDEVACPAEH